MKRISIVTVILLSILYTGCDYKRIQEIRVKVIDEQTGKPVSKAIVYSHYSLRKPTLGDSVGAGGKTLYALTDDSGVAVIPKTSIATLWPLRFFSDFSVRAVHPYYFWKGNTFWEEDIPDTKIIELTLKLKSMETIFGIKEAKNAGSQFSRIIENNGMKYVKIKQNIKNTEVLPLEIILKRYMEVYELLNKKYELLPSKKKYILWHFDAMKKWGT